MLFPTGASSSRETKSEDEGARARLDRPPIWIYWDKGISKAPPLIQLSVDTVVQSSDCRVNVIDYRGALDLLPDLDPNIFRLLRPAHQADIFRIFILERYGGMYVDADTIVIRSLLPLFDLLNEYSLVGADWKPANKAGFEELGISVMGPVKAGHDLFRSVKIAQQDLLQRRWHELRKHPWKSRKSYLPFPFHEATSSNAQYCFQWAELVGCIMEQQFPAHTGRAFIFNGAQTWFSYMGSPQWSGGDFGHVYREPECGEKLAVSPLYSYSHSLAPKEFLKLSTNEILQGKTILSILLRQGLSIAG